MTNREYLIVATAFDVLARQLGSRNLDWDALDLQAGPAPDRAELDELLHRVTTRPRSLTPAEQATLNRLLADDT